MRARGGVLVSSVLALVGCVGDGGDDIANRTSALCANVIGFEALAWDYYNGVPLTDAAVLPPPLPEFGGVYGHSDFPLLGFTYPPGWTPFEIRNAGTVGVDLIRNDQTAIWRSVSLTIQGTADPAQVRDLELDLVRDFFGVTGPFDLVCAFSGTYDLAPGSGMVTSFDNVLVRGDAQTVLVNASVTPLAGLPNANVTVHLTSSPTAEFPQRAYDTFMAIDWQMLQGDPIGHVDSDGDGWLDRFDQFPDDPTRH